jgi:hypothetical protein
LHVKEKRQPSDKSTRLAAEVDILKQIQNGEQTFQHQAPKRQDTKRWVSDVPAALETAGA